MNQKIVVALGGNALGQNLPEQMRAVRMTSRAIADLIEAGYQVVVSHGNGPQVGMIQQAMAALCRADSTQVMAPLSVCVAMSQGYIGYDLQNALREELLRRGRPTGVTTVLTQVVVDAGDPAFGHPTKPIGHFMTEAEAQKLSREKGDQVMEDAGRGWRRVVASPQPTEIVEIEAIRTLLAAGQVVIAAGGGGIPVVRRGDGLQGIPAVIDKDFASEKLAEMLDADHLMLLTTVEKVALHFGQPDQQWLSRLTPQEARGYLAQGHFAPGSMGPKVEAAARFAQSKAGRRALITLLEKALDGITGQTGTVIAQESSGLAKGCHKKGFSHSL